MGLGFLADGLTMASPPAPRDLGWYAFSFHNDDSPKSLQSHRGSAVH